MTYLKTEELDSLIDECQFGDEAMALARETQWKTTDFFYELEKQNLQRDCVDFFAHFLLSPTAIRWAYDCLSGLDVEFTQEEQQGLANIKTWLDEPSDENRRLHGEALFDIATDSPVAWVCQAIFWSGGSLTPPKLAAVEAQSFMCGHALSGGLLLSVYGDDAQYQNERFKAFIDHGKTWIQAQ